MARADRSLDTLLRGKGLVFFDGAMGTMLHESGVSGYACPEELNLTDPGLIERIHASYVKAGAQIIETNTFGANRRKLSKVGLTGELSRIIDAGVACARKAAGARALVAGSVGPLGEFLDPVGPVLHSEAREIFREATQAFQRAGADLLIIETMSDLKEVRAACLAARDAGLPFAVTMTFEEEGRTILGTPPEAAVITVEALGASMAGVNCSAGPAGLLPIAHRMSTVARIPLLAQPNAGLPSLRDGRTVFPTDPLAFAEEMEAFLAAGVRILGGCCGTTPDHIRELVRRLKGRRPTLVQALPGCRLAARSGFVLVGPSHPVSVIGERVNPTGRRQLAAELRAGNLETVRQDLSGQVQAGATLVDLNAGAPGVDETILLPGMVELAQKTVNVPLVLDSTSPAVLEAALAVIEGRPLINSVNASPRSLESILPLARRYGAAVIGLAMDDTGIPPDAAARLRLAQRIIEAALAHGLSPDDLLIDCLAVAAGSEQSQVAETLQALYGLRPALGVGSVLGVSNVSYGLPAREELNAAFLAMAVRAGLDAAIVNPFSTRIMSALSASQVLVGRDPGAAAYIRAFGQSGVSGPSAPPPPAEGEAGIAEAVLQGEARRLIRLVSASLDQGADPVALSQERLIPALEKVGELFEKRVFFLPQVMAAAEAVREAFNVLKKRFPREDEGVRARVLLATVEGDIHDLGKNIFRSLLENHGYAVDDLGINVPARVIADRARRGDIRLVGLSALMTTTLPAMEATIRLLRKEMPSLPVIVGGAVLTADYAQSIGADGYAPDASRGVKLVRGIIEKGSGFPPGAEGEI